MRIIISVYMESTLGRNPINIISREEVEQDNRTTGSRPASYHAILPGGGGNFVTI